VNFSPNQMMLSVGLETRTSDRRIFPGQETARLASSCSGCKKPVPITHRFRRTRLAARLRTLPNGRGPTCCPEPKGLKASGLSHWQVSSPRLLRLSRRVSPRKPQ
jgi:hypothetical protein